MTTLINEYLYADEKRLTAYVEQLASTKKQIKIPSWTAKFSLAGPSVEGSRSSTLQEISLHEKIQIVMQKLQPTMGTQANWRPAGLVWSGPRFLFDSYTVRRALIPGIEAVEWLRERVHVQIPPQAVWLCEVVAERNRRRQVLLVEDYPEEDKPRINRMSGYTAFSMLLETAFGTICGGYYEGQIADKFGENEKLRALVATFPQQPDELLRIIGGQIGPRRQVDVLFRVRAVDRLHHRDDGDLVVVGYPLFVAEHPSTFWRDGA